MAFSFRSTSPFAHYLPTIRWEARLKVAWSSIQVRWQPLTLAGMRHTGPLGAENLQW